MVCWHLEPSKYGWVLPALVFCGLPEPRAPCHCSRAPQTEHQFPFTQALRECTGTCAAGATTGPGTVLPPAPLGAMLASARQVFRLSVSAGAFVFLGFLCLSWLWPPQLSAGLALKILPSTALADSLVPDCAPIRTDRLVLVLLTSAYSPPFFLDFSCTRAWMASSRSACAERPLSSPPAPQGAVPRTHQVHQNHPLTPLAEPN